MAKKRFISCPMRSALAGMRTVYVDIFLVSMSFAFVPGLLLPLSLPCSISGGLSRCDPNTFRLSANAVGELGVVFIRVGWCWLVVGRVLRLRVKFN